MGTTLGELTKLVIRKMAINGEVMTPKAYAKSFCQEAKLQGVVLEECEELSGLIEKLDPATKELLKRYTVRSIDDLMLFLIYRIKSLHEGDKNSASKKILEDMVIEQLADFISSLLSPSVSHELDSEIKAMKEKLHLRPSFITNDAFQKEVKSLVSKRVVYDRKEIREEVTSINRMVDALSKRTIGSVVAHQETQKTLTSVQHEVTNSKFDAVGEQNFFEPLHKKLVVLLDVLERQSRSLSQALSESQHEVDELRKKVTYLEKTVIQDENTMTCDTVTNLFNEKGWKNQLGEFESRFSELGQNYCVAYFEIDFLEDISRRYGAEAADVVRRTFGQILEKKVRLDDLVARVKSERFVVTLANISLDAAAIAITKIQKSIAQTRFIYKDEVITVTGSAGLVARNKSHDIEEMLLECDKALHNAVQSGRNCVAFV